MSWHAKPSGGYSLGSSDWIDNWNEIISMLSWTDEAKAGMGGNMQHESGMNPWRWQGDSVNTHGGYGLPQFTPASDYLALSGVTPNMSTSEVTIGATPEDGARQIQAIDNDELHKWVSSCWRDTYWSKITYAPLWRYAQEVMNTWGNGSSVTFSQFKACTDIDACAFLWLACYEGPLVPNYDVRKSTARTIYTQYMGGVVPPTPDPPEPYPPSGKALPAWLIKKMADNSRRVLY